MPELTFWCQFWSIENQLPPLILSLDGHQILKNGS